MPTPMVGRTTIMTILIHTRTNTSTRMTERMNMTVWIMAVDQHAPMRRDCHKREW
ncbi:MAG: hypothetical protein ABF739_04285 [Acetobacter okinawensis]